MQAAVAGGMTPVSANPQAVAEAMAGANEPQLTFSLLIKKAAGASLGIDVAYSSAAAWTRNGVFIARVFEDGIVSTWNARSQEPRRVRPGDFIFQVNDVHGDTIAMIQEMKVKQQLTIHILRRSSTINPSMSSSKAPPPGPPPGPPPPPPPLSVTTAAVGPPPMGPPPEAPEPAPGPAAQRGSAATRDSPSVGPSSEGSSGEGNDGKSDDGETASARNHRATAEALLPQLIALGDEALAGLVCVALERRPWLRDAVLGPPELDVGGFPNPCIADGRGPGEEVVEEYRGPA